MIEPFQEKKEKKETKRHQMHGQQSRLKYIMLYPKCDNAAKQPGFTMQGLCKQQSEAQAYVLL